MDRDLRRKGVLHQRFQERIKEERAAKGLTQASMAKLLGISQPAYADIETGPNEPRLSTVERIAGVLRIEASDLLAEKILAQ